ncbi:hypothetical protein VaNZ11_006043 [Volvox africanus]|uniref:Uncharacterized protein n=1 Tax=Volvox africanus TaxID=51714 RepID=A0ABQ5RZR1_9CHLO|nr:hypothetical protein VaNZ11_006043 [Volvox africanus]
MQSLSQVDVAHEAAGFTGRFTAGLRYVESTCVPEPILLSDPLAGALAGNRGLTLAKQELEQLTRNQGPGKHLRVPARSRLIDDMLGQEIHELQNPLERRSARPASAFNSALAGDAVVVTSARQDGSQSKSGSNPRSGSGAGPESNPRSGSGSGSDLNSPARDGGSNPSSVTHAVCQVVSLGAGMCTRPWRLPFLASCHVFELDLPHITRKKAELLRKAGAQCTARQQKPVAGGGSDAAVAPAAMAPSVAPISGSGAAPGTTTSNRVCDSRLHQEEGSSAAEQQQPWQNGEEEEGDGEEQGEAGEQQQQHQQHKLVFPLLAASYTCIGADLSAGIPGALTASLTDRGFDPATPTIWILEALLYYMPLAAASELLCQLAGLSAPGSRLIATCVDLELLEASLRGVPKGHIFADLWHFEAEALLYSTTAFRDFWQVDWVGQPEAEVGNRGVEDSSSRDSPAPPRRLPASTRRLAKERLGVDTYVALYGGSELLFAAGLRQPPGPHRIAPPN